MDTDLTVTVIIAIVFMLSTIFLLVAYLGADKAAKERQQKIEVLTKFGNALYGYVKNDVAAGRTAFSFTGQVRPFEVWRNDNIDVGRVLTRAWERRYTIIDEDIGLPSPRPLTPSSLDAVGREAMEWQPKAPTEFRELDPKDLQ